MNPSARLRDLKHKLWWNSREKCWTTLPRGRFVILVHLAGMILLGIGEDRGKRFVRGYRFGIDPADVPHWCAAGNKHHDRRTATECGGKCEKNPLRARPSTDTPASRPSCL